MQKALAAEGLHVGQWQRKCVPAQDVFQNPVGYGKGCPWRCHDVQIDYSPQQHPVANEFLDSHFYVFDVNPPNDLELMGLYVEAFRKVMDAPDQVLD